MSASHSHKQSGPVDTVALGHETRDTKIRPLVYGFIATFVLLAFTYGFIALILAANSTDPANTEISNFVPPPAADTRLPPGPLVQADGDAEGDLYIIEQAEILSNYAVDPNTGAVRIPIDAAMELIVERYSE